MSYVLSFSDPFVILPSIVIDFDLIIPQNFAKDSMFDRVFFFSYMRKFDDMNKIISINQGMICETAQVFLSQIQEASLQID